MAQAYQGLSADHQYIRHSLYQTEENLRELSPLLPARCMHAIETASIT
jgi:hypothetical protein